MAFIVALRVLTRQCHTLGHHRYKDGIPTKVAQLAKKRSDIVLRDIDVSVSSLTSPRAEKVPNHGSCLRKHPMLQLCRQAFRRCFILLYHRICHLCTLVQYIHLDLFTKKKRFWWYTGVRLFKSGFHACVAYSRYANCSEPHWSYCMGRVWFEMVVNRVATIIF